MAEIRSKVIAIDGPSGTGKSTITKLVADKLDLTYLDTGAMFRGIAYSLDNQGITVDEIEKIESSLLSMEFIYAKNEDVLIEINGEDLTEKIRLHNVSTLASQYSKIPQIREYLKDFQRRIGRQRPSILEGRDIGTVIFPDAPYKFFLSANEEVRAERRLGQLKEKDPKTALTIDEIKRDIAARDKEDQSRAVAPLVKADDAIEIDTSNLTIEQVVDKICLEFMTKQGFQG